MSEQENRFRAAMEHSRKVEMTHRRVDGLEERVAALEKFLEHNGFVPSRVIEAEIARLPDLQKRDPVAEVERAAAISKATRASAPAPRPEPLQTSAEVPVDRIHGLISRAGAKLQTAKAGAHVGTPTYNAVEEAMTLLAELTDEVDGLEPL